MLSKRTKKDMDLAHTSQSSSRDNPIIQSPITSSDLTHVQSKPEAMMCNDFISKMFPQNFEVMLRKIFLHPKQTQGTLNRTARTQSEK